MWSVLAHEKIQVLNKRICTNNQGTTSTLEKLVVRREHNYTKIHYPQVKRKAC
jgi:hypothetical protein